MLENNIEPQASHFNSEPLEDKPQPDRIEFPTIQLLEERLNVRLNTRKVGEVVVRKVVETEMVTIPIRREKLIVEQVTPHLQQLAAIDLGHEEVTGIEAHQVDAVEGQLSSDAFITADLANQVLSAILSQPAYQKARVKLTFEDEQIRTAYQRWMDRYIVK